MLELGVGADLLRAIGWLYLIAALAALVFAVWLPETRRAKGVTTAAVIGVFGAIPVWTYLDAKVKAHAFNAKYEVAAAKFKKLCETAGDKIYKTVDNVEGIRLTKMFQEDRHTTNPAWEAAAFSREAGASYIAKFLWFEEVLSPPDTSFRGGLSPIPSPMNGYQFVEVVTSDASKVDRYVLEMDERRGVLRPSRQYGVLPKAKFGVEVEDLPDARDLQNWIAGGRIRIRDLSTNEIIAEHRRFAFDPEMGSTAGQRQQWLFAITCPTPKVKPFEVRFFVDQVLKPAKGNAK